MRRNPAYEPDYDEDGSQEYSRRGIRDGYRSDDDRYRDKERSSRYERRDEAEDERYRGRRIDGYSSEPDRRRNDWHDSRQDDRRFFRFEDRHEPGYYFYGPDQPPRQYYNPRDHPYYFPSRDAFHPIPMPENDPRLQPFYRYEGDMRRQPFYLYDPRDVYNPRYHAGPDNYFMGPPYQHRPYHKQVPRKKRSSKKSKRGKGTHVEFDEEVEERDFDPNEIDPYLVEEVERSKLRVRLGLLIFLVVLLVASVVLGAVATALEPWWLETTTSGTTTFESIKVGLWRTCYRPDASKVWVCHKYSEAGYESPYASITLLQWSMIVGSIAVFISLTLAIVAIIGRSSRYLMGIIYTIIFFAIGSTVLFGLVIAYVNEDKKSASIVSAWTKVTDATLETSTMFALGCAAVATSGMALIICCVFAFIYEPDIQVAVDPMDESDEEEEEEEEIAELKETRVKPTNKKVESAEKPKRQGTKYVKRDERDAKSSHMNGQVHHKEPAVITKTPVNAKDVRQPTITEKTPSHGMLSRHNYPPRDYEHRMKPVQKPAQKPVPKPAQKTAQKPVKKQQAGQPQLKNNVSNGNVQPTATQLSKPRPVKLPVTAQNKKTIPIYDGDYDKYFNAPY